MRNLNVPNFLNVPNLRILAFMAAVCVAGLFVAAPASAADIVGISKAARPIYPNMVGYNSDYYYVTNPWSSEKRVRAAVKARPGILRYPGGTSSTYWDVYHSRLFRDLPKMDPADTDPAAWTQTRYTINWLHNAYFWSNVTPLSDFGRLLAALKNSQAGGTQAVLVANLVTPGPDFYALKWAARSTTPPAPMTGGPCSAPGTGRSPICWMMPEKAVFPSSMWNSATNTTSARASPMTASPPT